MQVQLGKHSNERHFFANSCYIIESDSSKSPKQNFSWIEDKGHAKILDCTFICSVSFIKKVMLCTHINIKSIIKANILSRFKLVDKQKRIPILCEKVVYLEFRENIFFIIVVASTYVDYLNLFKVQLNTKKGTLNE